MWEEPCKHEFDEPRGGDVCLRKKEACRQEHVGKERRVQVPERRLCGRDAVEEETGWPWPAS